MELKVQIPFVQFLSAVKTLTPSQKVRLKKELNTDHLQASKDDYINMLLKGPVYSDDDIKIIEDNRKSIAKWRRNNRYQ